MGIDEEIFFVDYIRVIYNNQKERQIEEFSKDEISKFILNYSRLCHESG